MPGARRGARQEPQLEEIAGGRPLLEALRQHRRQRLQEPHVVARQTSRPDARQHRFGNAGSEDAMGKLQGEGQDGLHTAVTRDSLDQRPVEVWRGADDPVIPGVRAARIRQKCRKMEPKAAMPMSRTTKAVR